jgi:nucleotide-binding universal stress UspA family protein
MRNNWAMSMVTHLIIAHAAPPDAVTAPPPLPNLDALLARATLEAQHTGDPASLTPPHEHALAQALGWPISDGALPWAAWHAQERTQPCAWLTPCAWQASLDHVRLLPPQALAWQAEEAAALGEAFAALAAADGIRVEVQTPWRWLARGAVFDGWVAASLDRVAHRRVDPRWRGGQDASGRTLLRLLSETEMLFHEHPVNAARLQRGALPVNGLWISGAGRWTGTTPAPADAPARLIDTLTEQLLAGQTEAWQAAWVELDQTLLGPWRQNPDRQSPRWLTLCGEQGWRRWRIEATPPAQRSPGWRAWLGRWRTRHSHPDHASPPWWSGL